MRWIVDAGAFCVGAVIGFVWVTSVLFPTLWALPKALFWVKRGLFSWRLPAHFAKEALIGLLLTSAAFISLLAGLLFAIPAWAAPRAESAYSLGSAGGLIASIYPLITREGRKALRTEFIKVALKYVDLENPETPILLTEFNYRNRAGR